MLGYKDTYNFMFKCSFALMFAVANWNSIMIVLSGVDSLCYGTQGEHQGFWMRIKKACYHP
jgi:hypothetical protein